MIFHGSIYRKWGKIHWGFHPFFADFTENFHSDLLHLRHLNNAIIWSWYNTNKYSWENFRGAFENREKCESLAQRIFSCLQYLPTEAAIL